MRESEILGDDPVLPQLIVHHEDGAFPNPPRKRVRLSSPPNVSSDPALFSSDDDPSAENYSQERRKKKFRGPWYRQILASESAPSGSSSQEPQKKTKRKFERQFDSGVFLGSDETDLDEALESLETVEASALPLRPSPIAQTQRQEPSAEDLARGQIQRCLEDGNELIDLSSRGLSAISNATIRPLATFTRIPPVTSGVFYQLEPSLKIFLASNNLRYLPEKLFHLERLTALSLRGNELSELPPHIGNLQNLKELNISLNKLRYLPFEILDLFSEKARIQNVHLHPNPFFQPQFPSNEQSDEEPLEKPSYKIGLGKRTSPRARRDAICSVMPDSRVWHPHWKVKFRARTEVRYFDNYGSLVKGPAFPEPSEEDLELCQSFLPVTDTINVPEPPLPRGSVISRAPSLFEVALRSCAQSPQLPFLASMLPEDSPSYLLDLLAGLVTQKESGSSACTICERKFIMRRTEWIEWWEIVKVDENKGLISAASPLRQMENDRDGLESMIPLIRRGCNWLCVPKAVVNRDGEMTNNSS